MTPSWQSEVFPPGGSATGSGIRSQLGRPQMSELAVLVRESAQNSWDARLDDEQPVQFRIDLSRLETRGAAWRRLLLPGPPVGSIPLLEEALTGDSWLLAVTDRGTRGLGGPTRADVKHKGHNDFVKFFRNVGETKEAGAGGTYGFGKATFYRMSSASTILVDTRIRTRNSYERRLMGSALGEATWSTNTDERYTGRHWWGRQTNGIVEPLTGHTADEAANSLQLIGFTPDETGTTIYVPGLRLVKERGAATGREGDQAVRRIVSAILWNLWPKMIPVDAGALPPMTFEVYLNGEQVEVPPPDKVRDLRPFAAAYSKLLSGDCTEYVARIRQESDSKSTTRQVSVGKLAIAKAPVLGDGVSVTAEGRPFEGHSHHVARMRSASLVVDYLPGNQPSDGELRYGAVFRVEGETERHFASSEPATHDAWNPEGLEPEAQRVVKNARNWLVNELRKHFPPVTPSDQLGKSAGIGIASQRLASLIGFSSLSPDHEGADTRRDSSRKEGKNRSGASTRSSSVAGTPYLEAGNSHPRVVLPVRFQPDGATTFAGQFQVILDGGSREQSPPSNARTPRIVGWRRPGESEILVDGSLITVNAPGNWELVAEHFRESKTRLTVNMENRNGR